MRSDEERDAIRKKAHYEWEHDYFDGDVLADLYVAQAENAALRERLVRAEEHAADILSDWSKAGAEHAAAQRENAALRDRLEHAEADNKRLAWFIGNAGKIPGIKTTDEVVKHLREQSDRLAQALDECARRSDLLAAKEQREQQARDVLIHVVAIDTDDDGGGEIVYVDGHALVKVQAEARAWLVARAEQQAAQEEE